MMLSKSTNVFVSYSHADASLVTPVVKLLRVNKSLVFQDNDSIQPGKRWQDAIAKALAESQLVVVFWCDHARRSDEVSKEWKAAIEQEKDVLPLLLDATPLPTELAEFQWIDFRGTVGGSHTSIDARDEQVQGGAPSPQSRAPGRSGRWLFVTAFAAVFGIVMLLPLFYWSSLPTSTSVPTPTPVPTPTTAFSHPLLLFAAVLALMTCAIWLLRGRSKRRVSIASATRVPGEIERHIANEVEAEILRRTT